ncbi:hypothetical protein WI665_10055 [Vibrio cholerae]
MWILAVRYTPTHGDAPSIPAGIDRFERRVFQLKHAGAAGTQ